MITGLATRNEQQGPPTLHMVMAVPLVPTAMQVSNGDVALKAVAWHGVIAAIPIPA